MHPVARGPSGRFDGLGDRPHWDNIAVYVVASYDCYSLGPTPYAGQTTTMNTPAEAVPVATTVATTTVTTTSIGDDDPLAIKRAHMRASLAEFKKFDSSNFSSKGDDPWTIKKWIM